MCNHSKTIPIMHQTLAILMLLLTISIDANYGQQINGVTYNNTNNNNNNRSDSEEISAVIGDLLKRNERSIYLNLAGCALTMETNCFMGVAEDFVQTQKRELIVELDREVATRSVGRADQPTSSQLIETIMRGFNELTEIIRENLYEWFKMNRDAKESQDIENNEASNRNDTSLQKSRGREIEESRKKKKKKGKIHALIKAIIIGVLLFFKIKFLFKLAAIALQVKFFLVALGGLLLNAARLWIDLKKKKEPQKVIYYEHAQHQHHYEGDEDDWHVSEPEHEHGSYWGRAYETAQDLAYAKQKPGNLVKKQTENNSWGLF